MVKDRQGKWNEVLSKETRENLTTLFELTGMETPIPQTAKEVLASKKHFVRRNKELVTELTEQRDTVVENLDVKLKEIAEQVGIEINLSTAEGRVEAINKLIEYHTNMSQLSKLVKEFQASAKLVEDAVAKIDTANETINDASTSTTARLKAKAELGLSRKS